MLVKYIGPKVLKHDNVADTGLTWTPGQVHVVSDPTAAAKLLHHTMIWEKVDEEAREEAEAAPVLKRRGA